MMNKNALGLALAATLMAGSAQAAPPLRWPGLMDQLKPIGDQVLAKISNPNDPQLRAELDQMLLGVFVHGYLDLLGSDPNQPMLMPGYGIPMNYAAPNADTIYAHSLIDGRGVYRISGTRGTVPVVNLGFGDTLFQLAGAMIRKTDYNLDSLTIGPDGSYSVLVSAERPAGYTGDWWKIPATTTFVTMRQTSDDWGVQKEAVVSIQRVDIPVNLPRRPAAEIYQRIDQLPAWTLKGASTFIDYVGKMRQQPVNTARPMEGYSGGGGLPGQAIYDGVFSFKPDEALILEVEPPKDCKYWSLLLADMLFATVDWMNHQSSLNGHQAKLDSDGKFRAVIAVTDPGVPNWLDPAGRLEGTFQGRWLKCTNAPLPTVTKVKLASLRKALPKDTPAVTAEQRDKSLRDRKAAFQARRWW